MFTDLYNNTLNYPELSRFIGTVNDTFNSLCFSVLRFRVTQGSDTTGTRTECVIKTSNYLLHFARLFGLLPKFVLGAN